MVLLCHLQGWREVTRSQIKMVAKQKTLKPLDLELSNELKVIHSSNDLSEETRIAFINAYIALDDACFVLKTKLDLYLQKRAVNHN